MTTSLVYKYLKANTSLEYLLENTYIFPWESDVFGISKAGYITEIEVKSSRADFKADFGKVKKHLILQSAFNKNKVVVLRRSLRYKYKIKEIRLNRKTYKKEWTGKYITGTSSTTDLKAPKKHHTKQDYEQVTEICTEVSFVKVFCPHRFYYACPYGMIKKEEVPKYAGLYWLDNTGKLIMKKQAPIIHKIEYDLTKILLHKFYYKSLNLQTDLYQIKSQLEYLNKTELEGSLIDKVEQMDIQTMLEIY